MAEIEVDKNDPSLFEKFHIHVSGSTKYVENRGGQDPECEVWAIPNGGDPIQVPEGEMVQLDNCSTLTVQLVEETDTLVIEVIG